MKSLFRKWGIIAYLFTFLWQSMNSLPCFASDNAVYRHENQSMNIALSFDDGPSARYTREILDILAEYHIHATFFMIGANAEQNPGLVSAVAEAGHEIGNHTYSHNKPYELSCDALLEELQRTEQAITGSSAPEPTLFRPPEGVTTPVIAGAAEQMGYRIVLWSVDTRDWDKKTTLENIVDNVMENTCSGSIILFHDSVSRKESITPQALRAIIPALLEDGYRFVTISELLCTK